MPLTASLFRGWSSWSSLGSWSSWSSLGSWSSWSSLGSFGGTGDGAGTPVHWDESTTSRPSKLIQRSCTDCLVGTWALAENLLRCRNSCCWDYHPSPTQQLPAGGTFAESSAPLRSRPEAWLVYGLGFESCIWHVNKYSIECRHSIPQAAWSPVQPPPIPAQLQRLRLQMERAWPDTSLGPRPHQNVKSRGNWTLSRSAVLYQLRRMQSFSDISGRPSALIYSRSSNLKPMRQNLFYIIYVCTMYGANTITIAIYWYCNTV